MKKVYIFGTIFKIITVLSFAGLLFLVVKAIIIRGIEIGTIVALIVIIAGAILSIYDEFTRNVIVFDFDNYILTIKFGLSSKNDKNVGLKYLQKVEIVDDSVGFTLYVKYLRGNPIAVCYYKYSRYSFVERTQIKRVKRQIEECNILLNEKRAADKIPISLLNYHKNKAELLSLPYDEQVATIPSEIRWNAADDIANEWMDEDIIELKKYVDWGFINRSVLDLYRQINQSFTDASPSGTKYESEIWTLNGMKHHSFWEQQRQLAKQLLEELNKIQV